MNFSSVNVNGEAGSGKSYINEMAKLQAKLQKFTSEEEKQANAYYALQLSNLEKLVAKKQEAQKQEEANMQKVYRLGLALDEKDLQKQKDSIKAKYELEISEKVKAETKGLKGKEKTAKKKQIQEELKLKYQEEIKLKEDNFKKDLERGRKLYNRLNRESAENKVKEEGAALATALTKKDSSLLKKAGAIQDAFIGDNGTDLSKGFSAMTAALSTLTQQLDQEIENIAGMKTTIDTRLQGSKNKRGGITAWGGGVSYWDAISRDIVGAAGASPFVKQSTIASKVSEMVQKGIAYNVEQRAFLASISDKIAATFDAADGTLLRLIRINQQDSTAARLGMESAMTSFLNNMYETTEYLNGIADSVRTSLQEAEFLMNNNQALEFEYQVQKWLGSMYSVGMSQNAISSISSAIGKLAAGDISGLTGDGVGNLMIMAANNANLSIADILAEGLDASSTNKLMQAMVNYLSGIYDESKNSKVIQQQFASVYGLTASDLKSITNLVDENSSTLKAIVENNLTYGTAMAQLNKMASTMALRMSQGQMMTNAWENLKYSMAAGIANNPVLYSTYKIAGLLDDVAGGIALPDIKVMGTGINLQTNVADLMRVASLSGSILEGLGAMIFSGSGGGISGSGMLKAFGVGSNASVARGTGTNLTTSGVQVSSSGYIGNASSGDVYNKTMTDANDSTKGQLAEAQESEEADVTNKVIDSHIVDICNLIRDVTSGTKTFKVDMGNESAWGAVFRTATIV